MIVPLRVASQAWLPESQTRSRWAPPDEQRTGHRAADRGLRELVRPTGPTSYSYDDLNRLTNLNDGNGQPVSYGYDAVGNRTRLTYPDGKFISYGYDKADRLDSLDPSWDSGLYDYTYLNHRLDSLTRPSGLQTNYGYDSANRLITLPHNQ